MKNKIMIITDAWEPQINGVVTTISSTKKELEKLGYDVEIISHQNPIFKTFPAPRYPEVRLVSNPWRIKELIKPEYFVHVSTEGPLGILGSYYLNKYKIKYTSSYHTKTPEFLNSLWKIPKTIGYSFMKMHHKNSDAVLVTTQEMKNDLEKRNFHSNMVVWNRGVDSELFHPKHRHNMTDYTDKKILLYVGRVSKEKNMEEFFKLNIPGTIKIVVGDGPDKDRYEKLYTDTIFVGFKTGRYLAESYASADVFVFPSLWDTFGLVQIEAASCGTPIATFDNSISSKDIIKNGVNGYALRNLSEAVKKCLSIDRSMVREHTIQNFSWNSCTKTFADVVTHQL